MRPPRPLVPERVAVLQPFVDTSVLDASEVVMADALVRHAGPASPDDLTVLACAIAGVARRLGHVCVDLTDVERLCAAARRLLDDAPIDPADARQLPIPDAVTWAAALQQSPSVTLDPPAGQPLSADRPIVLAGTRIYLARYAAAERSIADRLIEGTRSSTDATRAETEGGAATDTMIEATEQQRTAVRTAMTNRMSVIVGGPGTGKTWTVGRILDLVDRQRATNGEPLRVALAAPTGKAAARLTEAVGGRITAVTLHRLLGVHRNGPVAVDPSFTLPHDLVVVDEASMIDLPMMARLLRAVGDETRLVLVGDPDQLASVEVGSVLRDVVDATRDPQRSGDLAAAVTVLDRVQRYGESSGIADLADAVQRGDDAATLAALGKFDDIAWVDPEDGVALGAVTSQITAAAKAVVEYAQQGKADEAFTAALGAKVLAAARNGPLGLRAWNQTIADAVDLHPRVGEWFPGMTVLVTQNDPLNGVANGDTGVVVATADGPMVAFPDSDGVRHLRPSRLAHHDDWWAMTIHKSQGSEFDHVVVSLPSDASPILTRELLYTAITRARRRVTLIATEAAIRSAVTRPVARASGLTERLLPRPGT